MRLFHRSVRGGRVEPVKQLDADALTRRKRFHYIPTRTVSRYHLTLLVVLNSLLQLENHIHRSTNFRTFDLGAWDPSPTDAILQTGRAKPSS